MTLGKRIEEIRQSKKISQKELAVLLNKNTADVALWESDEAVPSITDLSKLGANFGVSLDVLLADVEIKEEEKASNYTSNEPGNIPQKKKNRNKNKRIWLFSIIGVLIISLIAGAVIVLLINKPFSDNPEAIKKAAASVVKIYCYDYEGKLSATGSGFIAFDNQTVVTNYHVMKNAYTCKISTDEDKTLEIVKILNKSKEYDIALLKLKDPVDLEVLEIGKSEIVKKGETVTAIGSPLGIKNSVSKGVLSGRVMQENMDTLQFSAAISAGSSGGALFNERGEVIGITYASYENGQNLNLAVPIEKATELYRIRHFPPSLPNSIYLAEHDYISDLEYYLKECGGAENVTLDELKNNPTKWNGKIIRVISYVSSYLNDILFITDDTKMICGDYQLDVERNKDDFENTPILEVAKGNWYFDERAGNPGDIVCIIGEFSYNPKGTELPFFNGTRTTRKNEAILTGDFIYIVD